MDKVNQLLARIDELNIKERGLIMLGIVLACYMIWDSMLMLPVDQETTSLQQKIENKNKEVLALKQQAAAIVTRSTQDPDVENKAKLGLLDQRHLQADQALNEATEHLIAADKMSHVLEDVLLKTGGLKFLSMKGLGVTPLIEPIKSTKASPSNTTTDQGPDEKNAVIGAFKHGLQLQFEGGYQETLSYLKALEELPWSFFWHSVEYRVDEYPDAKATIKVYTLSLKDGWIDV